uniref:VM domain-containing protein n=1 Tax=Heliothis virescens TaxID=7102 RepID=A0A2A4K1I0_HELVI
MLTSYIVLVLCARSVVSFRTSTCLRENEEFSLCGWRCPATCINLRFLRLAQNTARTTMKVILLSGVFAVVALTVAGAPAYSEGNQPRYVNQQHMEEYPRDRRSHYAAQLVSPCAAANSIQVPVSSVPVAAFAAPSYQAYSVPQYGYAVPHYRSVDEQLESELLGFSDMDQSMQGHMPAARLGGYGAVSSGGVSPGLSAAGGRILTQATSGTALGVFPNANVGGCSVPLLFSCSPSIVSGHMAESHGHVASAYGGAVSAAGAASSYRLVDEAMQQAVDSHEQHDEDMLTNEHISQNHESSHIAHQ